MRSEGARFVFQGRMLIEIRVARHMFTMMSSSKAPAWHRKLYACVNECVDKYEVTCLGSHVSAQSLSLCK